ncbi:dTMP kinase [Nocardia transvalensis]|uniref:Thymidylate kinase n=1 Tax=Nocardia transvalensis TaxID=37333 RepID=A0A7W9UJ92_9NOCA|nr:dTMP kinase [Nocardia transvalensis]MBB5915106.1 dTMP kinase [Nocardia transvalensis]
MGTGILVTLDGPGGVGKTTVTREVHDYLSKRNVPVLHTCQPSRTVLGSHIRAQADSYHGMTLACLVAGDRHQQQNTEIVPELEAGKVVVCDRYLPSSLVLQVLDGVPAETVWALNTGIRVPDLAVILRADPAWIRECLEGREGGPHNRFERDPGSTTREAALFDVVAADLEAVGWPVQVIDCTNRRPYQTAGMISDLIAPLLPDGVRASLDEGRSA